MQLPQIPAFIRRPFVRRGVVMASFFLLAATLLMPGGRGVARGETEVPGKAIGPGASVPKIGAILPLHGTLTDVTVESLKRRISEARLAGASVIVLDMDTPGGLVTSSIALADLIRHITDMKTIAWVNPNAHSGGALVALAAEEIVMTRSSRIGDSQVIMGGPEGAQPVPKELQAKAYTPVLADFRQSATLRGYSQVLAEAFVIPEREVWWLENIATGERKFVFADEKKKLIDERKDAKDEADNEKAAAEWKLVETYYDILLDRELPLSQPIEPADQLLEMSASEAYAYGFSKGIVSSTAELMTRYGLSSTISIAPNWSEDLAYWLTSMYVRGFLLIVFFLGLYIELHTPGAGLAGLVALIALAIFVGAPYLTGLANIWEILLIVLGLILLGVELFLIPGFGAAGVGGIILILVGLLATFVPEEPGRSFPLFLPTLPGTQAFLKQGVLTIAATLMASLAGMVMLSKYLPKTMLFRRLVPANPMPSQVLVEDPYRGAARVGDIGEAEGPLRPAGKARFGSVLADVVTQGEYVEPRTRVEVIERRGSLVIVRKTV